MWLTLGNVTMRQHSFNGFFPGQSRYDATRMSTILDFIGPKDDGGGGDS